MRGVMQGGVNRVRAQGHHVATFADTGAVHIYDIEKAVESLDGPVDKQVRSMRFVLSLPSCCPPRVIRGLTW